MSATTNHGSGNEGITEQPRYATMIVTVRKDKSIESRILATAFIVPVAMPAQVPGAG